MIVGTHFGLFMPALRPNWQKLEADEPELQVRARRRIDLLNLRKFMQDIGLTLGEPFSLPNTDYQWRAYCTRRHWGLALLQMSQEIDYTKFKDTPQKYHGDNKLTEAYGKIWTATIGVFPEGSVYTTHYRSGSRKRQPRGGTPVSETVFRTETREWRMAGSDPQALARLMREIDNATEDVVIPTDAEIAAMLDVETGQAGPTEVNGHLDHSKCTHNPTPSARKKCRKRFYGRS